MASSSHGEVTVDGERYEWEVNHYAGATSPDEKHRTIAARVRAKEGGGRELLVDFPNTATWFRKPRVTAAFEREIAGCITTAIESGWRPDSRGKPFRMGAGGSP